MRRIRWDGAVEDGVAATGDPIAFLNSGETQLGGPIRGFDAATFTMGTPLSEVLGDADDGMTLASMMPPKPEPGEVAEYVAEFGGLRHDPNLPSWQPAPAAEHTEAHPSATEVGADAQSAAEQNHTDTERRAGCRLLSVVRWCGRVGGRRCRPDQSSCRSWFFVYGCGRVRAGAVVPAAGRHRAAVDRRWSGRGGVVPPW
ncbi:hypothetical protein [Kutzneria kofuensis]|uniref:hypothetical protein n=1 Tax=Kutzneria kofuensis TaxID=103725 RepID=UPI0031ED0BB0